MEVDLERLKYAFEDDTALFYTNDKTERIAKYAFSEWEFLNRPCFVSINKEHPSVIKYVLFNESESYGEVILTTEEYSLIIASINKEGEKEKEKH